MPWNDVQNDSWIQDYFIDYWKKTLRISIYLKVKTSIGMQQTMGIAMIEAMNPISTMKQTMGISIVAIFLGWKFRNNIIISI